MSSISLPATGAGAPRAMALIEARRLARHPAFIIGTVLAFGVLTLMLLDESGQPAVADAMPVTVIAAFFIGLPSLIAMAGITRSTDVTAEAIGTVPHSEARRTVALLLACLVPFATGVVWLATYLAVLTRMELAPQAWWFGTVPAWELWTYLIGLGPVACLGGALLGVLTGRWLRFRGASAVVVLGLVLIEIVGQTQLAYTGRGELRLWLPWAEFNGGSEPDGTQVLFAGNPAAYLGYVLCLCAAAALVAIWHDRTARTTELRALIAGVVVVGLGCLLLAMTTGASDNRVSDPVPFKADSDAGIRFDPAS